MTLHKSRHYISQDTTEGYEHLHIITPSSLTMKQKLALASWVVAVILSVVALLLPPTGVIDHSVIILVAQFLLLCATFLGVDSYVNMIKSHYGKAEKNQTQ